MKTNKIISNYLLVFLISLGSTHAQVKSDLKKNKIIHNKVVVEGSPQEVWKVLKAYGDVSSFNATIDESYMLNEGSGNAELGAEREIHIPNGINNIINKERIVDFVDGVYYTYDVYDTENFPIRQMEVTYGVRMDNRGRTILFSKTYFKLNNRINTKLLKGKIIKGNMDSLLAFKYFIENGDNNSDIKSLRKRYDKEVRAVDKDEILTDLSLN